MEGVVRKFDSTSLSLSLSLSAVYVRSEMKNRMLFGIGSMASNERVIYLGCENLCRTPDDDVRNSVYLHEIYRSTETGWSSFRKIDPMRGE